MGRTSAPVIDKPEEKTNRKNQPTKTNGKKQLVSSKKTGSEKADRFFLHAVLMMLCLITIILAAGYWAVACGARYTALKIQYEEKIRAAQIVYDAAAAEYADADSDSEEHIAQRRQLSDEMIAAAKSKLESLRERSEEINAEIAGSEARIGELKSAEDYDYYRTIYEEYLEGRTWVEELLSGD